MCVLRIYITIPLTGKMYMYILRYIYTKKIRKMFKNLNNGYQQVEKWGSGHEGVFVFCPYTSLFNLKQVVFIHCKRNKK